MVARTRLKAFARSTVPPAACHTMIHLHLCAAGSTTFRSSHIDHLTLRTSVDLATRGRFYLPPNYVVYPVRPVEIRYYFCHGGHFPPPFKARRVHTFPHSKVHKEALERMGLVGRVHSRYCVVIHRRNRSSSRAGFSDQGCQVGQTASRLSPIYRICVRSHHAVRSRRMRTFAHLWVYHTGLRSQTTI